MGIRYQLEQFEFHKAMNLNFQYKISFDSKLLLKCTFSKNELGLEFSSEVILFLQNPEFFNVCTILDRKIHTIEMLLDPIQKFCLKMAKIESYQN